jgi:serine/threonine protein kinase
MASNFLDTLSHTQHGAPSRLGAYNRLEIIGYGYLTVFWRAMRYADRQMVCLKNVRVFEMTAADRKLTLNEVKFMEAFSHPNLFTLIEAFIEQNELWVCLEFISGGGNLGLLIHNMQEFKKQADEFDIWRVIYFISAGLSHMHQHGMFHKCLKPTNVLITDRGEIKVYSEIK